MVMELKTTFINPKKNLICLERWYSELQLKIFTILRMENFQDILDSVKIMNQELIPGKLLPKKKQLQLVPEKQLKSRKKKMTKTQNHLHQLKKLSHLLPMSMLALMVTLSLMIDPEMAETQNTFNFKEFQTHQIPTSFQLS